MIFEINSFHFQKNLIIFKNGPYLVIEVLLDIMLKINEDKSGKADIDSALSRKLSCKKI